MVLDAQNMDSAELNRALRHCDGGCHVRNCLGQRYIGCGMADRNITVSGTPGAMLGAFLHSGEITVLGNAQDAVGDTMNGGRIVIHGNVGDAVGYAMRGGSIFVKGNAGYRAGIHMKQYGNMVPVLVIGGRAGSFLGEYQAGGILIVLGLHSDGNPIVSDFPCAGMYGGEVFLRGQWEDLDFPEQVTACRAEPKDLIQAEVQIRTFCRLFSLDPEQVLDGPFTRITPDSSNPYGRRYVKC